MKTRRFPMWSLSLLATIALSLSGAFPAHGAGSAPLAKVDTFLGRLIRDTEARSSLSWALPSAGREATIRTEYLPDGSLAAAVLVRTREVATTRGRIEALGGYVRVEAGDVVVAVLPVGALASMADRPETVSISASRFSRPLLDVSRKATKADLVQVGSGLPAPRKGAGTIVGIVDSGIDYRHEDFRTDAGTRIRSIWDISGVADESKTPRICSRDEINAGTCAEKDLNGHGTHVAGTAAGNGRAKSGYVGMAPEAEIIAAKATRSTTSDGTFSDDDVLAACAYIFDEAKKAGKPAVVNLSLGRNGGPLDGTSSYEKALDNLTGPGRVIVAANGNEGADLLHLSYAARGTSFAGGLETAFRKKLLSTEKKVGIDIWYASGEISFGLAYREEVGKDPVHVTAAVAPGKTGNGEYKDASGKVVFRWEIDASVKWDPNNGARRVVVEVEPVGAAEIYTLYSHGSGTFDAWVYEGGWTTSGGDRFRNGDTRMTVGTPASARRVIAAGNYVTKTEWVNASGGTTKKDETIDDIDGTSSRGPTRDGRVRPDVSAPGAYIAAALSRDSQQDKDDIVEGGKLVAMAGTSMASPHVAGIAALLLEASPKMTVDQVLYALQSTAVKDAKTGDTPNNTWGAGKVDALAAAKAGGGDPTKLYTLGRKLSVKMAWRDQYKGTSGTALPVPKGDQYGFFYFAEASNPEVFVKTLDFGPQSPYLLFWGGLTDFEYTVTFTNEQTGMSYTQTKPAYSTAGGANTTDLSHVRAVLWDAETGVVTEVEPWQPIGHDVRTRGRGADGGAPVTATATTTAVRGLPFSGGTATPGPAAGAELLLDQGQIGVTVTWQSQYSGEKGTATPLPQDDQFGFFYFSDAGNPEVFVKSLDWGSDLPFVLFAAGLTDFQYTVTFRNRKTLQEVVFTKQAGAYSGFADGKSMNH